MLFCTTSLMAQITTSGLSGKVTADNEEVIGATVEAVHTPSGTRYVAVTNDKGVYTINGMRPGGPYKVTISYIGYKDKVSDNITLQLAQTSVLNASMTEDAQQLGEVVVSAKATKFTTAKTGASTNIDNAAIVNMPTVSRSITDYTRLSPYGGNGMTFGGSDGRTANFTVDGADFNNNFGLNAGLPGGGSPISIDAISEMQIVVSPFDVRQSNFIGGGVNAITKSGTNTFKGTAYIYHQNEQMHGDAVKGVQIENARAKDRETTYGFTLGGPILKDKLFFFVNGEMTKKPTVANRWRGSEDGKSDDTNYISRTKLSDLQTVKDYVMGHTKEQAARTGYVANNYGYDTGSYTDFPADESNYKFLARLDWNINQMHHLALRYNYTKATQWNAPNASSMDGGSRAASARTSVNSMSFANSMYSLEHIVKTFSLDFNSRLSNELSNQFLATYSKLDDVRGTKSSEFPFIDILDGEGDNYMALGYELFTWNNAVHNTVVNIKDDLTWYKGNHKFMFGLNYEHQMADNAYMRNGTGYYRYKTLEDFLTGGTPEVVCLTYGYNGETSPAARVQYNKAGLYAQDEWNVSDKLKLTYGLRLDGFFFDNGDLMTNNAIYELDYNGRHIDTGKWPKNSITLSPRVGFTWDVFGDQSLKVRGGTGLFTGRLPLVFFTNMPTNSGMIQYKAQINEANAKKMNFEMNEFKGGLITDAEGHATTAALISKLKSLGYPMTIAPETGTTPSSVVGVDPNFKMPEVWKTSLGVDYAVPVNFPLTVSGEFVFDKTVYSSVIREWHTPYVGEFAQFNGADSRYIYPAGYKKSICDTEAYMLENTSKGYGYTATLTVNARPWEWIDLMASYTHKSYKELTSLPGSDASSVLNYMSTVNGPNYARLHNSRNGYPDRFIVSANLHDKCGNHYSFILEGQRGYSSYSYMTTNDMNGDGYNFDALYVPTDEQVANGDFRFKSDDDRDRFMAFVHANSSLEKQQGKYCEAYSLYSPWLARLDFAYKHDFKLNVGKTMHKLQLSFDMKNVLNFFNNEWGIGKGLNTALGTDGARLLKYEGADAQGYATFSTPKAVNGNTPLFTTNYSLGQCWYASIGVKYFFN